MNALELLKQDHEEVKELFEQAEGTEAVKNKGIFLTKSRKHWRLMRELKKVSFIRPWKSTHT